MSFLMGIGLWKQALRKFLWAAQTEPYIVLGKLKHTWTEDNPFIANNDYLVY